VLADLLIVWLAIRMRQGRVRRGSPAGVRTRSTMRSDAVSFSFCACSVR
jgi:hypothetical protein